MMHSPDESDRNTTQCGIGAYAELLAMDPGFHERRRQLIEEIVRECDARYRWLMYSVIRAMRLSVEDAEDILQDILLRWSRRLEAGRNLPKPEALTAWFKQMARYAAIAHLRRVRGKRREAEVESARRRFDAEQSTPLEDLALKELHSILMASATAEMRSVIELWGDGLTYREIAEQLKAKNAEAIRDLRRKAVGLLRGELMRQGCSVP